MTITKPRPEEAASVGMYVAVMHDGDRIRIESWVVLRWALDQLTDPMLIEILETAKDLYRVR